MKRIVISMTTLILILGVSGVAAQVAPLSLDECTSVALEQSYSVKSAEYLLQQRDAQALGSWANILPSVSVSASTGRTLAGVTRDLRDVPQGVDEDGNMIYISTEIVQPYYRRDGHSTGLNIGQNIYDGGRWWNAISQARENQVAGARNLDAARNQAVFLVSQRYFQLAQAKALLEVYTESVRLSEEQLARTESQYELGAVARTDVYSAKVLLGNDRVNMLTQDNIVALARSSLNIAMGREPLVDIEIIEVDYVRPEVPSLAEAIQRTEQNNPNIKVAESNLKSAEYGKKISRAAFLPNLSGSVRYSRSNSDRGKVYSNISENWGANFGLTLSLNIFRGYADKANIESSDAQYLSARENLIDARRNAIASIENALISLKAYEEIEEINVDNQASATEDLRLATERYQLGSGTILEVQNAQVNLTRANSTLVRTRYNSLISRAALDNVMGVAR